MIIKKIIELPPTLWVTFEIVFSQTFGLIIFSIQAPILGPYTFGLITLIMVFVGFWEAVPASATNDALIAIREIDPLHFHTVTTTSVLICLAVGGAIFGFAGPLATALGNAELAPLMRAMSALPVIQAFTTAPLAAALRELRFQSTAARTIVSLVAGGVVGLALTFAGAGAWALVCQALVQRIVAAIVLWLAVPISLRFAISRRHLREIARFALPVMAARAMNWASGQCPRLILGIFLGPTDLGLFSLAVRLIDIVRQVAITPRSLVARVDLRRFAADPEAFGKAVRRVFQHISFLTFPLCVGGAAVMPTLCRAWLDPRWLGAVIPAQIMLLTGLPYVTFYVATAALLALNRQNWEARISVVQGVGIMIAVGAFGRFGLVATASAIAAILVAALPLPIIVMRRQCKLSLSHVLSPQVAALVASLLMGVAVWLLRLPIEVALGSVAALCVLIAIGTVLYVILIALTMRQFVVQAGKRLSASLLAKARHARRPAVDF
jgi:polysaccharide transporter, PST family